MRYRNLNRLVLQACEIFENPNQRSVWLSYINDLSPFTRNRSTRVRVLPPSHCCAAFVVCTIASAGVHRRSGEQVSGTSVLEILHRESTNKVFGKSLARLLQVLHHGSSFVQVRRRGEPSSATSAAALRQQNCLRPVISVRLPKSPGSVSKLFFHLVFNHVLRFNHSVVLCY